MTRSKFSDEPIATPFASPEWIRADSAWPSCRPVPRSWWRSRLRICARAASRYSACRPDNAGGTFLHLNGRLGRRQRPIIGTLERLFGSEADTARPRDLVSQLVPRPLLVFAREKDKVVPSPPARAFEAAQARNGMFVFPNA